MPLESTIEAYLVKRVEKEIGGVALKGDVAGRRFIDRICIMPGGRTIWVECKRPRGGHRRPHQIETIKRLQELGHEALFISTKDQVDVLCKPFERQH